MLYLFKYFLKFNVCPLVYVTYIQASAESVKYSAIQSEMEAAGVGKQFILLFVGSLLLYHVVMLHHRAGGG